MIKTLSLRLMQKQITTMNFTKNVNCILISNLKFKTKKINFPNGFFRVQFLFCIALVTSFVFAFSFIFYASQSKDQFRKACATTVVDVQKNIVKSEKILFSLNKISTAYRIQISLLQATLLVTPPSGIPVVVAQIKAVQQQQQILARLQANLITNANRFAAIEYLRLAQQTNNLNQQLISKWTNYLNIFSKISLGPIPRLAIRPDSIGGVAPNYEFDDVNIKQQNVALNWQNRFSVNERMQTLFAPQARSNQDMTIRYGMNCSVGIERINSKWQLKINLDRL